MSKKLEHFPFYINYADVDLYCFWLADNYEDNANLIKVIDDSGLLEQCDNPKKYKKNADTILLELRQCLADNGFEKEIEACDKAFADESRLKRGMKNPYIPMHERW